MTECSVYLFRFDYSYVVFTIMSEPSRVLESIESQHDISQATQPSSIPPLNYLRWTSGTAIAKSKQRSISKVTALLCFALRTRESTNEDTNQKALI